MGDFIIVILIIVGAFWAGQVTSDAQDILPKHYEAAASMCYPNGGIKVIHVSNSSNRIVCANNAEFVMEK